MNWGEGPEGILNRHVFPADVVRRIMMGFNFAGKGSLSDD